MTPFLWTLLAPAGLVVVAIGVVGWLLRRRHMDRWLPAYVRDARRYRSPAPGDEVHLILCMADHFEPKAGRADRATGLRRVQTWVKEYPAQFARFRDSDGRPPRYTFFFPAEEYEPEYLDLLAELCRAGFGEVELHLHHHNDTPDNLRKTLAEFRDLLATRHGLLGRRKDTGALAYGFIHGNWALCNARPDGTQCGVNGEIPILVETGCYADFTFPSAPSPTQPPMINTPYHASDRPGQPRSADTGVPAGTAPPPPGSLLIVPGPLVLDWTSRKAGLIPGTENGCLQTSQPPAIARLPNWLRARVQVPSRPDWYFVKLHAHGAPEDSHDVLLGPPMVRFHEDLARRAAADSKFHFHYVTAREMANLIRAAEAGYDGGVAGAMDWAVVTNIFGSPHPSANVRSSAG
jgi:hypothetical protein